MTEEDHTDPSRRAQGLVGTVLRGKWRLDAVLGVGGSASVFAATHKNGKRGAIKLLHPELAAATTFVERFLREGYVANKIGHPGIVSILDEDRTDEGGAFLVMELLEGESVEHSLQRRGAFGVPESLVIALDVLDALAAAHGAGVLHRDMKPGNVFLTTGGEVKILDFGIARLEEPGAFGATRNGAPLGTPAFMPPEQARGRWDEVDARSDVFSVGATLYNMLSGRRPRDAVTSNEELLIAMTDPLPSLGVVAPHLPPSVVEVIDRATAFDKATRFPSAHQMRDEVLAITAHEGARGAMPTLTEIVSLRGLRAAPAAAGALASREEDALGPRVALPRSTETPAPGRAAAGGDALPTPARAGRLGSRISFVLIVAGLGAAAFVAVRVWREAHPAPVPKTVIEPITLPTTEGLGASPSSPASGPVPTPRPPTTGIPHRKK